MTSVTAIAEPTAPTPSLWRSFDFRHLWVGNAASQLGAAVTLTALPLLAVTELGASATELGLLQASYLLPSLLLPLMAGVWLERRSRRPVMIVMDIIRGCLVASIPVAYFLHSLTLGQLYIAALLTGGATVVFDIAAPSYLPSLVGPDTLTAANSHLDVNRAVAGTTGPALAGWLAGVFGAAPTMIINAGTAFASALALSRIRHREAVTVPAVSRNVRAELREGLGSVFGNPPVRNIAIHAAVYNFGSQLCFVAYIVYVLTDLNLSPGWYGLTLALGGVGAVVGALSAASIVAAVGFGRAFAIAVSFSTTAFFLIPLARSPHAVVILSAAAFFFGSAGSAIGGIIAVSVRQLLTPARLHARMNASYRMLQFGVIPIAAVIAGALVDQIGARATLWVAPIVLVVSAVPILMRPVRSLKRATDLSVHTA